jgi:hypothetical protein
VGHLKVDFSSSVSATCTPELLIGFTLLYFVTGDECGKTWDSTNQDAPSGQLLTFFTKGWLSPNWSLYNALYQAFSIFLFLFLIVSNSNKNKYESFYETYLPG